MGTIPKFIDCKLCGERFANPIKKGYGVVIKTCDDCRRGMFSAKGLRKMERQQQEMNKIDAKERAKKIINKAREESGLKPIERKSFISLESFRS
tara:strand:- start:292 stop:573 length:282 start_codon:yes stop_codon:yes gene_type:complete